jgi:DNA-binding GntR family transcriptional regulator
VAHSGQEGVEVTETGTRLAAVARDHRRARSSAAEVAASALREMVMQGDLGPGARLAEEDFLEPLDVSRNTLREAFRLLAHEKLLEHKLNRGVFVRRLCTEDVVDLFVVRRMVECGSLGLADAAGLARLRAAVERGEAAAADARWVDVGTANIRFHQAIAGLSGSRRIDELMAQVAAELRLAFHEMGDPRAFHDGYLRRNRQIADALTAGDQVGAADLLRSYLDDAEKEMVDAFRAMGRG